MPIYKKNTLLKRRYRCKHLEQDANHVRKRYHSRTQREARNEASSYVYREVPGTILFAAGTRAGIHDRR